MRVLTDFNSYQSKKNRPLILTIGTFDGVHLGHQRVLDQVCKRACETGGISAIITFSEHPMHVLRHKEPPYLITSTPHRLRLLDQLGFDHVFLIKFNKRFSLQSPRAFVKNILVDQLNVSEVVLGYDSRFGKNREGRASDMSRFAREFGFKYFSVPPKLCKGKPISSTEIRSLIQKGEFSNVKQRLNRPYSIIGDVVKGSGLGRKLGFPTANLNPHSEALPPCGVYLISLNVVDVKLVKTRVPHCFILRDKILKKGLNGLLNIGTRPTVTKGRSSSIVPEIHILDFKGNLYGKILEVIFIKKIRNEVHFESLGALKKQIKKDILFVDKFKTL